MNDRDRLRSIRVLPTKPRPSRLDRQPGEGDDAWQARWKEEFAVRLRGLPDDAVVKAADEAGRALALPESPARVDAPVLRAGLAAAREELERRDLEGWDRLARHIAGKEDTTVPQPERTPKPAGQPSQPAQQQNATLSAMGPMREALVGVAGNVAAYRRELVEGGFSPEKAEAMASELNDAMMALVFKGVVKGAQQAQAHYEAKAGEAAE